VTWCGRFSNEERGRVACIRRGPSDPREHRYNFSELLPENHSPATYGSTGTQDCQACFNMIVALTACQHGTLVLVCTFLLRSTVCIRTLQQFPVIFTDSSTSNLYCQCVAIGLRWRGMPCAYGHPPPGASGETVAARRHHPTVIWPRFLRSTIRGSAQSSRPYHPERRPRPQSHVKIDVAALGVLLTVERRCRIHSALTGWPATGKIERQFPVDFSRMCRRTGRRSPDRSWWRGTPRSGDNDLLFGLNSA
jgi:hypothetical protein